MSHYDQLHRFLFEHQDIRGEIVSLEQTYQDVLRQRDYPDVIRQLLGEFLAAASLLSSLLKFDGIITLQAQGDGPLRTIMADCTRNRNLRAIAQLDGAAGDTLPDTLPELIGNGHLAITIDPAQGQRYQGLVPLEAVNLAGCLESYFRLSEQLPTRFWFSADGQRSAGLLLQTLPTPQHQSREETLDTWQELTTLASSITPDEQLQLPHEAQLHRLFHQHPLRLFEPCPLHFQCSCSRERTAVTLVSLGEAEMRDILAERGLIEVECQYCGEQYRFDEQDINQLFDPGPPTVH